MKKTSSKVTAASRKAARGSANSTGQAFAIRSAFEAEREAEMKVRRDYFAKHFVEKLIENHKNVKNYETITPEQIARRACDMADIIVYGAKKES